MKNPYILTLEQRRSYIFEEHFEGEDRTRFSWITDCLLGDIRTFLDGIKEATGTNQKIESKLHQGGGNLSVPILISTALEFVAALYAGKTQDGYMKFPFPKEEGYVTDLNDGKIPDDLKNEFKNRKFPLPENPAVKTVAESKKWKIKQREDLETEDAETKSIYYHVNLMDKGKKLHIHFLGKKEYKSTDNVETFINEFFPKEYQEIPRILWDGVRHGLVHTFYPKFFTYTDSDEKTSGSVQFQFYVENQNVPSHFKSKNNEIFIRINVFELFRVLEKAIEKYRDRLKCEEKLQENFIQAWSSIEEYTESLDDNQKKEMEKLKKYLD